MNGTGYALRSLPATLAVTLLACAHTPAADASAGIPALESRQAEFFASSIARDADRIAALFADDAVLHVANMPVVEGREAIRRFYGNLFRFQLASRADPADTRVSASGDLAYTTGSVVNTFPGTAGPVEHAGKYVIVWRRVADEWLVALHAVSSDGREAPQ